MKILFYGYLNNTYSSPRLARTVKDNIYFMWLSRGLQPDSKTINNFREKNKREYRKTFQPGCYDDGQFKVH
ncbi:MULTISPECIES: transposase [unclassified Flavobacterium]|uniref:transposase n=1 Tax=unclassified Flavobacterium TaxID=196869 RepID=UPI0013F4378B|nr:MULTISPECIES: transposase [unclassified Flavobacterium]